ncbi:HAD-IA family hydrolase [Actinotalea subterranea]|uniref:HAD-IA family hydrolase n=1 Tax=Actinotalea subterranea TaxID=2607497 RepID=UPI0011F0391F|nr:HAD-IA family hydrolase [Actinotalea subterranea]
MSDEWAAQALLFDNDGVLVDSTQAGEAAWREWSRNHGVDPEAVLLGLHGRRSVETVARHLPADQVEAATAEIDALELTTASRTQPIRGAAELLGSMPGGAHALVTSGPRALAEARILAAGLPVPAVMVTSEDVEVGKPAPDPYLRAAERLGVDIARCAVLEDSPNGIAAAHAAGAGVVVGVGPAAVGQGCDAVVADLAAVRWADGVLTVLDALA